MTLRLLLGRCRTSKINGFPFPGTLPRFWPFSWRDIIDQHVADLGGEDNLSTLQISLCTRAATIEVQCEQLEARLSQGEDVDIEVYNRLLGTLRRTAETLGLHRIAKNVAANGNLDDYVGAGQ